MVIIDFLLLKDGFIKGFDVKGHAGYDVYGKDTVCAAVSSAMQMTANTLTDIIRVDADVKVLGDGHVNLFVAEKDLGLAQDVLNGFKMQSIILEEEFPECIKVNVREFI